MIKVIGPRDKRQPGTINTTSRSNDFGVGLSPFILGPVDLYKDGEGKMLTAVRVENAWQYSKVYPNQVDKNGDQLSAWYRWARNGWNSPAPRRYPMGKGAKPLYSYWDGAKLSYIEARKQIYIPCYTQAVLKSRAWDQLCDLYFGSYKGGTQPLYLWDFDGYATDMSYWEIIHNENRSLGHAFVLAMLLEGYIDEKGQITGGCQEAAQGKEIHSPQQ